MLAVRQVEAAYGKIKVLDGLSLAVPGGSVVALLGGNGTGKSTALKAIAGLVSPTAGEIVFDGRRIDGRSAHEVVRMGLSLVPQGKDVFPQLTVEENLLMGGFIHRRDRHGLAVELERVQAIFPVLATRRRQAAGTLSGGEQQMLAIGRALMSRPKFLMLDEPSAALAPRVVEEISRVIRQIHRQGVTILLVEQNVAMALALAEYAYVLRDGRVAFEERAVRLLDTDLLKTYYLG
ncbi:MAG: ABC transporter ATP-binding protein [Candidatus Rokubacteria bacterium]|nr:ABC transporter ATP-binding protein [Candidatus Rokubacteria bacterium]